jgi:hypothetical protein
VYKCKGEYTLEGGREEGMGGEGEREREKEREREREI